MTDWGWTFGPRIRDVAALCALHALLSRAYSGADSGAVTRAVKIADMLCDELDKKGGKDA